MIDKQMWDSICYEVDEHKKSKLQRLLSGNCEVEEYSKICGFFEGIEFFEEKIREARNPKTYEGED